VDLGTGATFDDRPAGAVDRLVDAVAGGLAGRNDCPAVTLTATDRDPARSWTIGPEGEDATEVASTAAELLAVPGIGLKTVQDYGAAIFRLVAQSN
jgi:hypothetical protein